MPAASAAAIEAGRAVVRFMADDSPLRNSLQAISVELKTWGSRISNLGRSMAIAGAAGAALFIKPIQEAARVEQLMQRFAAVFDTYAASAGRFADTLAKKINQSRLDIRDQLAQYQAYLKGMGFSGPVATQMSQSLTQLTQDWIAFDDTILNGQEAMDLFMSALSGEVRPARRMGADLRVAAMDAEFLGKGVKNASEKMTEMERVTWRYHQIFQALNRSGVVGQAEREVGTAAAQQRGLKAVLRDTAVAIGNEILPAYTNWVSRISDTMRELELLINTRDTIIPYFAELTLKTTAVGVAFLALGKAIKGVVAAMTALKVVAAFKFVAGHPVIAASIAALTAFGAAMIVNAEKANRTKVSFEELFAIMGDGAKLSFKAFMQYDFGKAVEIWVLTGHRAIIQMINDFDSLRWVLAKGYRYFEYISTSIKVSISWIVDLAKALNMLAGVFSNFLGGQTDETLFADKLKAIDDRLAELRAEVDVVAKEAKEASPEAAAERMTNRLVEMQLGKEFEGLSGEMIAFAQAIAEANEELESAEHAGNVLLAAIEGNRAAAEALGVDLSDAAMNSELIARGFVHTVKQLSDGEKALLRWNMIQQSRGGVGWGDTASAQKARADLVRAQQQREIDRLEREQVNKALYRHFVYDDRIKAWSEYYHRGMSFVASLKQQAVREGYMLESLWKLMKGRARAYGKEWTKAQAAAVIEKSWEKGYLAKLENVFWRMFLPKDERSSMWSTRGGFGSTAMAGEFQWGPAMDIQKEQLITQKKMADLLFWIGEKDGALIAGIF